MKIILFIAIIFAVLRFFIPSHPLSPSGSYEAFAHLFLGGLIGAFCVSKYKPYLWTILGLSAIEIIAFFAK